MLAGCRVVLVSRSYFPDDPRLARQASVLLAAGASVDVVCLRRPGAGEPARETVDGVAIRRLGGTRKRASRISYLAEYGSFGAGALCVLVREHARRRFSLIQVANPPDALVACGLPLRLVGAAVILDIHDLAPELYASKFGAAGQWPLGSRVMALVERLATRSADHVLVAGDPFSERLIERGLDPAHVTSIPNGPDERLFDPAVRTRPEPSQLVYHGSLFDRYGLDLALEAFPRIRVGRHDVRLDVWGDGPELPRLIEHTKREGLADAVTFHGAAPLQHIPTLVGNAACGLSTLRSDPFTELAFPTKVAEYAQLGVPVAASRTEALTRLFPDDALSYYPPGEAPALAAAVLRLLDDPAYAQRQATRARESVAALLWSRHAERYIAAVDRVVGEINRRRGCGRLPGSSGPSA